MAVFSCSILGRLRVTIICRDRCDGKKAHISYGMKSLLSLIVAHDRVGVIEGEEAVVAKSVRRWVRVRELTKGDKSEIGLRCGEFIADVLTPRFLPEIRLTEWNFPVAIHGKWRGSKFSFIIRYRSGWKDNAGEEFDSAWVRLDHDEECLTETRFHIMWHRHTGQWFPYHSSATLDEALHMIETDPVLQPHT